MAVAAAVVIELLMDIPRLGKSEVFGLFKTKKRERGYLFMDLRMEAFIEKAGVVLLSNTANMTVKDFPKKI